VRRGAAEAERVKREVAKAKIVEESILRRGVKWLSEVK